MQHDTSTPSPRGLDDLDIDLSDADAAFGSEWSAWLDGHLPAIHDELRAAKSPADKQRAGRNWQSQVAAGGWAAISWPAEFGGRAATARQQLLYYLISAEHRVPPLAGRIGINLCGPTL
ncbi:MAG: acyl-CoA dehydrogenase, partial [Actinomycetota bacterium]|nr:acyl-CoA dehydrogenase [Actinomycetota bacterium]